MTMAFGQNMQPFSKSWGVAPGYGEQRPSANRRCLRLGGSRTTATQSILPRVAEVVFVPDRNGLLPLGTMWLNSVMVESLQFISWKFSANSSGSLYNCPSTSNWCRCEFVQPITVWMCSCNLSSVQSLTCIRRQIAGLASISVISSWYRRRQGFLFLASARHADADSADSLDAAYCCLNPVVSLYQHLGTDRAAV